VRLETTQPDNVPELSIKVRDQGGRALAYGVPSATRPGLYHFANSTQCTCPAGQRGQRCWHTAAVGQHVAAVRTQQLAQRYDDIFGGES